MTVKVGIPRGLLYYKYAPLWLTFFNELGAEVILSSQTNKHVLNQGTHYAVDDACIPVKLYHGHVLTLVDKVDYLFIPRLVSISDGDFICPKFCGLPEMIKHSLKDLPKLIDTTIDLSKSTKELKKAIYEIGLFLTSDKKQINSAYEAALITYNREKSAFKYGQIPLDKKRRTENIFESTKPKIMIMGHPYILYDTYLNMNVFEKLRKKGFDVITPEMIADDALEKYVHHYDGKIFWSFSRKLIGSCLYLVENQFLEGVIFISSFGCGIDSLVGDTVERRIRKQTTIPFMFMTLDEHSGEAGYNTRLEAFVDMLNWREQNANYISTHG